MKSIKPGTIVRLNYNSNSNSNTLPLKHPLNQNLGTGVVQRRWSKTSYSVHFPNRGDLVLNANDLIIVKSRPKNYSHPAAPDADRVTRFTQKLHGSGIDYDWQIQETKTSIRASNAYHTMNEAGFYGVSVPFTVIFPKDEPMKNFKLQFATGYDYAIKKHMLRSFLEDQIAFALDSAHLNPG